MIYDLAKKLFSRQPAAAKPEPGAAVAWTDNDAGLTDVSRSLDPEKVDRILRNANTGYSEDQSSLALELPEKNWDVFHAVQTRTMAVQGVRWSIEPGGESSRDDDVAESAKQMLQAAGDGYELESFDALVASMMSALLPGFSAHEIVWEEGGQAIAGFQSVEQYHFRFDHGGRRPLLITENNGLGMELEPVKWVFHRPLIRPGAPCRGGLIRPLCWLHTFTSVNIKDLLAFIERYGMPFIVAQVDEQSWQADRNRLKYLIRNFGPSGGGVFSKNVEFELMQAANNTGEVYFTLLEYCGQAVTKAVLGQTATAGDGGGWSNDNAQGQVRQDILEADCDAVGNSIQTGPLKNWIAWNYGPDTPAPLLKFHYEPPEDVKLTAEVASNLFNAGLEWDEKEASERFGMTLRRSTQPAPGPAIADSVALSADDLHGLRTLLAATMQTGRNNSAALAADDDLEIAPTALDQAAGAAGAVFAPIQQRLDALAGIADDAEFARASAALADDLFAMFADLDTTEVERIITETIHGAAAAGAADRAENLKRKENQ